MTKEPYLSGEELYRYYFSMGDGASIQRLAKWAVSEDKAKSVRISYRNKEGLPFMGVWKAMWRWASLKENRNEAYLIFSDYVRKYGWLDDTDFPWEAGSVVSLSDWHRFMLKKIKTAWQFKKESYHKRFLLRNGWS